MNRRQLLSGLAGLLLIGPPLARSKMTTKQVKILQDDWKNWLADGAMPKLSLDEVRLSKKQWREQLDAAAFDVLRKEGTERAGSSAFNQEKRAGIFACAGCQLPLFTSEMKYESGTGWPSFFTHIPGHLETKTDYKLIWPRTEYHCVRCGGHQGHVFDDGPEPTGQRWCNNGVALEFWPKDA